MSAIPEELIDRKTQYCERRGLTVIDMRGYGVDGAIWETDAGTMLKVFRRSRPFRAEMKVYERLELKSLYRLAGFAIPLVVHHDEEFLTIEMTIVEPPYILDFAGAQLDARPTDAELEERKLTLRSLFGNRAFDVSRLLEALLQYGIHYTDVHAQNIRV